MTSQRRRKRMAMPDLAPRLSRVENYLGQSLARDQFRVHYQPQVDCRSRRWIGVEALVRWDRPGKGLIPPDRFIPLAETTGFIVPLGEWVLRTACAQTTAWQHTAFPMRLSVNVAAKQLADESFVGVVQDALRTSGMEPTLLQLELTESESLEELPSICSVLNGLRDLGIEIAIDDFGTGRSSLSQLLSLPLDVLKIDKSFIGEPGASRAASIASSIILLGHDLGLKVIAEGVETEGQLEFLQKHDCDEAQGYLFSPAVTADSIGEFMSCGREFAFAA